jgi:hypothetical protein
MYGLIIFAIIGKAEDFVSWQYTWDIWRQIAAKHVVLVVSIFSLKGLAFNHEIMQSRAFADIDGSETSSPKMALYENFSLLIII